MKRVAVTGGSGLLGRAVVRHLAQQGYAVRSIDRVARTAGDAAVAVDEAIESMVVDLTDVAAVQRSFEGCDAVVHLAAIPTPIHDPWPVVYTNNTVSSYNVLHAAATLGIRRVCMASSINAVGLAYSRSPRFDYFPLDERHPTYNEDAYSLSKWVMEQQGDSFARRWEHMSIASLRFHGIAENAQQVAERIKRADPARLARNLWGFVDIRACVRACQLSIETDLHGHEVFFIVAPNTLSPTPSLDLARQHYPDVSITGDLSDHKGFFDIRKATRLLGWTHD